MLRPLLSVAVLVLLLASRAQAATIDFVLTVNIPTATAGPQEVGFQFGFFESGTYTWPSPLASQSFLILNSATLLPGTTKFNVSLDVLNVQNLYFFGSGTYYVIDPNFQNFPTLYNNFYVAEPPTGHVQEDKAIQYGPPGISVANLGGGFASDFGLIFGFPRSGGLGTWALSPAPGSDAAVPEPATLVLFGSGLVAVVSKKYRQYHTRSTRPRIP
jgi:hypothetical protein